MRSTVKLVGLACLIAGISQPSSGQEGELHSNTGKLMPRSPEVSAANPSPLAGQNTVTQVADNRMLPGIVAAVDVVTLSVPMNGVLDRIHVSEGDRVTCGQQLAALDDRIALASVRLAEVMANQNATILQARQQQQQAERFLGRVRNAQANKAASDHELDQAQADFDSACQSLKQAEERQTQAMAQLELERAKLAGHQIVAPFDGSVSRIVAHVGESMNTSQPLMQIVNLSQLQVDLHVPAVLFGKLVVGSEYSLDAGVPVSSRIPAKLKAAENVIDAATNTFRCVFLIDNHDEKLPAGFVVRLVMNSSTTATQAAFRINNR